MSRPMHATPRLPGRMLPLLSFLVGVPMLLVSPSAAALRCDGDLVNEGDPAFQVREACGTPDFVLPLYAHSHHHGVPREELWYYNFGPNRLVRELRIRDGRLARIRTTDHGFNRRGDGTECTPNDISTGMTGYELFVTCGEPVQREARRLLKPQRRNGVVYGHRRAWVEEWYYTFDDRYIDRRVRLVDGRVAAVDTVD